MDNAGRPTTSPERKQAAIGFLLVAAGLQLLVLFLTFIQGLNWSGWVYNTAVGQALVGMVVVFLVGRKRPALAFLVPIVSVVLTFGLHNAENQVTHTPRACTTVEEAAIQELTPPDGQITELVGYVDACYATVTTAVPSADWRAHYDRELADHGWQKLNPDPERDPDGVSAVRDGFHVDVHAEQDENGEPVISLRLAPR